MGCVLQLDNRRMIRLELGLEQVLAPNQIPSQEFRGARNHCLGERV